MKRFITLICLFASVYVNAAVLHVTVATGSGPGSLKGEVDVASPGDVISLDVPYITTTGEIPLNKDLTILSGLSTEVVIDGAGARIFNIDPGVTITLKSVQLRNGVAPIGGGILCYGDLNLSSVSIIDCEAVGNPSISSDLGGGIWLAAGSNLFALNATWDSCDAFSGSVIYSDGGAMEFINSNFLKNEHFGTSGTASIAANNSDFTFTNCLFDSPERFMLTNGNNLTLEDCTIQGGGSISAAASKVIINECLVDGSSIGVEGLAATDSITVTACTVVGSSAFKALSIGLGIARVDNCSFVGNDGGLSTASTTDLEATSCLFFANEQGASVGGNFLISNCAFIDNDGEFGTAMLIGGTGTIDDCNFENNLSTGFNWWIGGTVSINPGSDVAFNRCDFIGNETDFSGAAIGISNRFSNPAFASVEVNDCTFKNNMATNPASSTTQFGGAIAGDHFESLTINRCTFENNEAENGGAIGIDAITISHPGNVAIENSTFSSNDGYSQLFFEKGADINHCTVYHEDTTINSISTYVFAINDTVLIENSIIYGKVIALTPVVSIGGNVFSNSSHTSLATHPADLIGMDAEINETLQSNGGLTSTHALLQTSPARGLAASSTLATDQRGIARAISGSADAGAYEYPTYGVPGTANIFSAGLETVPNVAGTDGTLAVAFELQAGTEVVVIDTAWGTVNCSGAGYFAGPDGGVCGGGDTYINSFGSISGLDHDNKTMMLVGVFIADGAPSGAAPIRRDESAANDRFTVAPALNQTFVLGDGMTSWGEQQEFTVPAGATRLFIGFVDAWAFTGTPGYYGDNDGEIFVELSQRDASCSAYNPPQNLSSTITASAVELSWDPVQLSVGCRVSGRPLGAPSFGSATIPGSEVSSFSIPLATLSPGTYEWTTECACSVSPLQVTPQAGLVTFTVPTPRLASGAELLQAELNVYPNPAVDFIQIGHDLDDALNADLLSDGKVIIMNILGEVLLESNWSAGNKINVGQLDPGSYLLQINYNNGATANGRFSKINH